MTHKDIFTYSSSLRWLVKHSIDSYVVLHVTLSFLELSIQSLRLQLAVEGRTLRDKSKVRDSVSMGAGMIFPREAI